MSRRAGANDRRRARSMDGGMRGSMTRGSVADESLSIGSRGTSEAAVSRTRCPSRAYRSDVRCATIHHAIGKIPAAIASLSTSPAMNGVSPFATVSEADMPVDAASHGSPIA